MRSATIGLLAAVALLAAGAAAAGQETSGVLSPMCSAERIKALAEGAVIKIEANPNTDSGIYNVTLDTDKMTFAELVKKLVEAGCME